MSHVTVFWNTRQLKIKTTPAKPLHEVRTEACEKLGLTPPANYILKRNKAKLDLSLPIRLHNLPPGTRLDLITGPAATSQISITLRVVEPVAEQITGTFPSSYTIWQVLRKIEADARAAGRNNVNITERAEPNSTSGQGRLVHLMPAVRMVGKELTGFEELGRTLQELGCGSRELLVLRFLKTEVPFEEAVEKIGRLANGEQVSNSETATPQSEEKTNEDVEMTDSPAPEASSSSSPPKETATPDVISQSAATPVSPPQQEQESTSSQAVSPVPLQAAEAAPTASSKISVYQPSSSAQLAAATMQVPDEAYDLGIEDIKRMRAKYQELAQPQRLPSDKEIEEKNAAIREEMEKVALLKIKVRYPDGYTSMQELSGKSTAQDLYDSVRTTMRHPNEPFVLVIPPRESIPENRKRLTVDLRLRSGASLHLTWSQHASDKAKNSPVLNDELMKQAKELPKPVEPADYGSASGSGGKNGESEGKAGGKEAEKRAPKDRGGIEGKLKGLLRLSKK